MTMTPLRPVSALAIDGGGIKGLVVARALVTLEDQLGGGLLIKQPQIKILTGTSTGAVITGMIAIGMSADQIAKKYRELGQQVFPPLSPTWLPTTVRNVIQIVKEVFNTSLYPSDAIIKILREFIKEMTGDPDLTLAGVQQLIGPDKALILTTVNIIERQTYFLKSYSKEASQWKLWEAILASSLSPVALPVLKHANPDGTIGYFTDGGVGSFGNPAYIAAREAVDFQGHDPQDVSILSFGTGWVTNAGFEKATDAPDTWRALNWAVNAPQILTGDIIRNQSLDILENFTGANGIGIDFRRFQFSLDKDIDADAFADDHAYEQMAQLGDQIGEQLQNDQFAPNPDSRFDPEGLYSNWQRRLSAMKNGTKG